MYYKVLTKDMRSPLSRRTRWAIGETTKLGNKQPLKLCWNGLHLYTSLNNVSIGEFGSRVFNAEPVDELLGGGDKICCRAAKLICELDPAEVTDPEWAFYYCRAIKDILGVRRNITTSEWAYKYCLYVKDRPSVAYYIEDRHWLWYYLKDVKGMKSSVITERIYGRVD